MGAHLFLKIDDLPSFVYPFKSMAISIAKELQIFLISKSVFKLQSINSLKLAPRNADQVEDKPLLIKSATVATAGAYS